MNENEIIKKKYKRIIENQRLSGRAMAKKKQKKNDESQVRIPFDLPVNVKYCPIIDSQII